jgi:hypothetical protein
VSPNDEVERRGGALPTNEADLFQSSTSLLGSSEMILPRSLEPIVRQQAIGHRYASGNATGRSNSMSLDYDSWLACCLTIRCIDTGVALASSVVAIAPITDIHVLAGSHLAETTYKLARDGKDASSIRSRPFVIARRRWLPLIHDVAGEVFSFVSRIADQCGAIAFAIVSVLVQLRQE